MNILGFDKEREKVEKAISMSGSEQAVNIAIIAGPYAGKTTFMDFMYYQFPIISSKVKISCNGNYKRDWGELLRNDQEKLFFIDDCHLLYRRRVDGFDALEKLLNYIANHPDYMFITSWNLFSWEYLSKVLHIEKHFPCQIYLPELEAEDIKTVLMSPYDTGEVIFEPDNKNTIEHFIEFRKYTLQIKRLERTINIPFLKLNYSLIKEKLYNGQEKKKDLTLEDMAFVKIKNISSGNIPLSRIIWQKSLQNSTIKVDEIYTPSFDAELDYDTTFIGFLIFSMGRVSLDVLEDTIGDEIDITRSLALLRKHNLVEVKNNICAVSPEAIKYLGSIAKKARLT
ncbi:hypothetical protein [Methanolobus halotolerans]|uniref:Uncharacterized protein n=1 Tax=Methanolobus halotolerans TaxID=2052935 RepID=A0A4E0PVJ8_9EURY|nr:hypothetical protein [Methanolobus halotolerans]TGC09378.1 hypothetical protein CUN85_05955 [Methanolobus halotolerans]